MSIELPTEGLVAHLNTILATQFVYTKGAMCASDADAQVVAALSTKLDEITPAAAPHVIRYYNYVVSALSLPNTPISIPASTIFGEDFTFDEAAFLAAQKEKQAKKNAEAAAALAAKAKTEIGVDVLRMKVQVGKAVAVAPHPTEERMHVVTFDIGGPEPLTVVCGVADWLPAAELEGTLVPVITNLKAGDVKGVMSSGRCLVATSADGSVKQMVQVPAGAAVGEVITYRGAPATEFDAILPAKRFHKVLKDFVTDAEGLVASQNAVLETSAGPLTAPKVLSGTVA